jgi:hypothetical protein
MWKVQTFFQSNSVLFQWIRKVEGYQRSHKSKKDTTQWPKDEGQTTQWPKDEGQTTQWPKEKDTKGQTNMAMDIFSLRRLFFFSLPPTRYIVTVLDYMSNYMSNCMSNTMGVLWEAGTAYPTIGVL